MADRLDPMPTLVGEAPPTTRARVARVVVLQPRSALGKLLLTAALVGGGIVLLTLGVAIALSVAALAVVTGLGVVVYRAVSRAAGPPPARLDPAKEILLPKGD
jgi:hypothetical protein